MIEIKKPKITYIKGEGSLSERYGKFVVEPLERGFGITIGNAFRRILLSSLPGVAITSVRIEGVLHEFTTIPGVVEDVMNIVFNLKEVVARMRSSGPEKVRLTVQGEAEVKAGDFARTSSNIEIINPDHHIATVSKGGKLDMEVTFEKGRGFVAADKIRRDNHPLDTIFVDALFSPIKKVKYEVLDTRVGHEINYDKLIIEIWTNGSIKPDEALNFSARLFNEYLKLFIQFRDIEEIEEQVQMTAPEKAKKDRTFDIPIKELELSVRARNCLEKANITKIGELSMMTVNDLMAIKNFGKKSLMEIKEKLAQYGLSLRDENKAREVEEGDKEKETEE